MGRYLGWALNAVLLATGCFLVARTVNAIAGALLAPSPTAFERPAESAAEDRSAPDPSIILARNLFNASVLAPPPPAEPVEDLEATKLPLRLLGTAATSDGSFSWAAVENLEQREPLVVRVSDEVINRATVLRIERGRIVLSENGTPRELLLSDDDDEPAPRAQTRAPNQRQSARARYQNRRAGVAGQKGPLAERVRRLAEGRYAVKKEAVEEVVQNPSTIFSEARVLPKYEDGAMVGIQVNAIRPGSVFQRIGVKDGEVITEVNGIAIDSPEQSQRILEEFSRNSNFTFVVDGPDGPRTLTFATEP